MHRDLFTSVSCLQMQSVHAAHLSVRKGELITDQKRASINVRISEKVRMHLKRQQESIPERLLLDLIQQKRLLARPHEHREGDIKYGYLFSGFTFSLAAVGMTMEHY